MKGFAKEAMGQYKKKQKKDARSSAVRQSSNPSPYEPPPALKQSHTETHAVQIMHELLCLSGPPAPNTHTRTVAQTLTQSATFQSKPEGLCFCVLSGRSEFPSQCSYHPSICLCKSTRKTGSESHPLFTHTHIPLSLAASSPALLGR